MIDHPPAVGETVNVTGVVRTVELRHHEGPLRVTLDVAHGVVIAPRPAPAPPETWRDTVEDTLNRTTRQAVEDRLMTVDGVKYAARCFCQPADVRGRTCVRCGTAWVPAVIVHGRIDTGHYLFEAIGRSRPEVADALLRAYAEHVRQMPAGEADPGLMADLLEEDEVSWTELEFGQAARDGETIA